MKDIYEECPSVQSEHYLCRLVEESDVKDLLEVYSDKHALPYFNSDNCDGDIFFYETEERMKQGMEFWLMSYREHYFVRFTIIDLARQKAIGTIEYFIREMEDGTQKGLLRLDLHSDYEVKECMDEIFAHIVPLIDEAFGCKSNITKAAPYAVERIAALKSNGYVPYGKNIIGEDGTAYGDYWISQ